MNLAPLCAHTHPPICGHHLFFFFGITCLCASDLLVHMMASETRLFCSHFTASENIPNGDFAVLKTL